MNYNGILSMLCGRNDTKNLKIVLDNYNPDSDEIDILYDEGKLFKLAMSNENLEICKALLSFFNDKQIPNQKQIN